MPFEVMTVVAGCGGGESIASTLEEVIKRSRRLVLDADALNAIARSNSLTDLIRLRQFDTTVMTPHPLEAARLLDTTTENIQKNRLQSAQLLAQKFAYTVILKGSGSIISSPTHRSRINTTGDGRLATAGTGDVLAGLISARLAAGEHSFEATCAAAFIHGYAVKSFNQAAVVPALDLSTSLSKILSAPLGSFFSGI
jgi:hydroxyethylthiazole kinase-like uncharacterized protein yjeF